MSQCHHCAGKDGMPNVPAHGPCFECNFATCAHPSGRVDSYFHGEQCNCGCRKFVCEFDIYKHAKEKHSRDEPVSCFPALAGSVGAETFGGAASALATDRTEALVEPGQLAAFNRWLNLFRPGRAALVEVLGRDWERPEGRVIELKFRLGDLFVEFTPAFYSVGTLQRVLALSGRSLAGLFAAKVTPSTLRDVSERVSYEFRTWAATGYVPGPLTLRAWLPPDTPEQNVLAVRGALASTRPPDRAADIARWVVEAVAAESTVPVGAL